MTDFSPITSAGDWSPVVLGLVAVAAAVVVLYVAWRGAAMLVAAVHGGHPADYYESGENLDTYRAMAAQEFQANQVNETAFQRAYQRGSAMSDSE